jgi:asparagine synthase (glutamine-hydrolysing)
MCGIVGTNFLSNNFDKSIDIIKHRGPDNQSSLIYNNNQFGHTRLSIIDLDSKADQPMEFDDIIVVFNGEIYNYKELIKKHDLEVKTKSDTEVLIRLYQKYEYEFLDYLNGMFAFAIYDKKKDRFFCARDRFGKKPFYYYFKDNKFIFASEIKSILKILNSTPDFNQTALGEYLTFWTPIDSNTFYSDIYKLEAGCRLIFCKSNISIKRYYFYDNIKTEPSDETLILKDIEELLFESINSRLVGDVCIASMLSGGVDSSFISAIYSKISGRSIDTYCIGYDEHLHYSELGYAQKVAKYINSNHHEIIIDKKQFLNTIDDMLYSTDEPLGDSACIPSYLLSNQISKDGFKVVLSGEGSDEIFLGYDKYFKLSKADKAPMPIQSNFSEEEKTELFLRYNTQDYTHFTKYNDNLKQSSYIDLKIWISEVLMSKIDRMSMANSLEVRAPFLDFRLVEYLLKVDSTTRQGDTTKYLFKKIASKYLPKEIVYRQKKGFSSPFVEWLYDEYGDEVLDTILIVNEELNIFNKEFVRFLHNEAKQKRFKQHIWNLYIFARWFKRVYL